MSSAFGQGHCVGLSTHTRVSGQRYDEQGTGHERKHERYLSCEREKTHQHRPVLSSGPHPAVVVVAARDGRPETYVQRTQTGRKPTGITERRRRWRVDWTWFVQARTPVKASTQVDEGDRKPGQPRFQHGPLNHRLRSRAGTVSRDSDATRRQQLWNLKTVDMGYGG